MKLVTQVTLIIWGKGGYEGRFDVKLALEVTQLISFDSEDIGWLQEEFYGFLL
jgi:hypothetical protein